MLGEFVLGLTAKDSGNRSFAAAPLPLTVSYEHAVRCKAMTLIRKGATFKDALKAAWEVPIVKERHFTTPLCLETAGWTGQADTHSSEYRPEPAKHPKGGSKGTGNQKRNKGAGKGKGNRGKGGCTRFRLQQEEVQIPPRLRCLLRQGRVHAGLHPHGWQGLKAIGGDGNLVPPRRRSCGDRGALHQGG
jgi:hypothetical protein